MASWMVSVYIGTQSIHGHMGQWVGFQLRSYGIIGTARRWRGSYVVRRNARVSRRRKCRAARYDSQELASVLAIEAKSRSCLPDLSSQVSSLPGFQRSKVVRGSKRSSDQLQKMGGTTYGLFLGLQVSCPPRNCCHGAVA